MTAETENLVLEHLQHIRSRVDQIADDMAGLKQRMAGVESAVARIKHDVAYGDETDARQQVTLDKLAARIERIEQRLELRDH